MQNGTRNVKLKTRDRKLHVVYSSSKEYLRCNTLFILIVVVTICVQLSINQLYNHAKIWTVRYKINVIRDN